MTSFERFKTLESDPIDAIAVGNSLVVVCSGSQVTLVSETDKTVFDHEIPVSDVTISDRIVILSDNQLTAYDPDGTRTWERSFDAPHAVTTLPLNGVIGVLEPDTIRMVDPNSGQERMTVTRDPTGRPDDDQFLGTKRGFVSSTWSLLHCVDQSGETLFKQNLDAAIQDIGCVDETLVVALKNGYLKGFELSTGEQKWQTELPVHQISPQGEGMILLSTDDGIKSVTPDGAINSVQGINNGRVYANPTNSLICTAYQGSIALHVPKNELIDIETVTESVGIDGTIELKITSLTDTDQEFLIHGELEHAELSPSKRQISLNSQASSLVEFPVSDILTDGEAEFTAIIQDRVVAQQSIMITDAGESELTADASIAPVTIEDNAIKLRLTVENTGRHSLDSVRILEAGKEITNVGAGETCTAVLTKVYEASQPVTVGVEVTRGNRRTEFAPTCEMPPKPSINTEQKNGALHATVKADERVVWVDELVMEVPGADRVRSPVEIKNGSLQIITPIFTSGRVRVGLANTGITAQERMTTDSPQSVLDSHREPSMDPDRHSGQRESDSTASTRSGTPTRTERGTESETNSAHASKSSADEELVFEREVSSMSPPVGHVVTESVQLHNGSDEAAYPTVRLEHDEFRLGELAPNESRSIDRSIVCRTADTTLELPRATLSIENTVVEKLPPQQISPVQQGISLSGVANPDTKAYHLTLENNTPTSRQIVGVALQGKQQLDATVTLEGEATTELTGGLQTVSNNPIQCTVRFADSDQIRTLLPIQAEHPSQTSSDPFRYSIGSNTKVAGEYGTVILEFHNDSDTTLTDVTLTASGENINDILYSPVSRESFAPDEQIEHFVDLKTTAGEVNFNLTANWTVEEETQSFQYQVTGPAVSTESEWTADHRTEWTVTAVTANDTEQLQSPTEVTTQYELRQSQSVESKGVNDTTR